jgi:hypothetical protein
MRVEVEVPIQVQLEGAVRAHVGPKQRRQRAPVFGGEVDGLVGQDALQQKGVDVFSELRE